MTDELEKRLKAATPRGARAELRSAVLDRVATVLAEEPGRESGGEPEPIASPASSRRMSWESRLAWTVAASLLIGVGLNFAAIRITDGRLAAYQPEPEVLSPQELVVELARTDLEKSDFWDRRRFVVNRASSRARDEEAFRRYHDLLGQCLTLDKEPFDVFGKETRQKDPEVDVHRLREPSGDHSGWQCPGGLDHRYTA
ncbi:MAG TPA: hypothetical protein DD670_04225 [Planctomycetaceae bacterium]|nr:hypothetical protein [Planctomycetaceae bacterium]